VVNTNRGLHTLFDNVVHLLDGQSHTLFPVTNLDKVVMTHITDTLKALRTDDWKQSFPSLFSDVCRRVELIIALNATENVREAKNRTLLRSTFNYWYTSVTNSLGVSNC
jgi:hypothetical protein